MSPVTVLLGYRVVNADGQNNIDWFVNCKLLFTRIMHELTTILRSYRETSGAR
jgi:hypothetical protein